MELVIREENGNGVAGIFKKSIMGRSQNHTIVITANLDVKTGHN